MFQLYTGNGKGKTTASIGLGLRAVGDGKKVLMVQFLKTEHTSEVKAIRKYLKGRFTIQPFGRSGFPNPKVGFLKEDFDLANKAVQLAQKGIKGTTYDVIIMDEINVALEYGLLKLRDVLKLIRDAVKRNKGLVFTGRYTNDKIIQKADLVSEIKEVKHPYRKGVLGKVGVEY